MQDNEDAMRRDEKRHFQTNPQHSKATAERYIYLYFFQLAYTHNGRYPSHPRTNHCPRVLAYVTFLGKALYSPLEPSDNLPQGVTNERCKKGLSDSNRKRKRMRKRYAASGFVFFSTLPIRYVRPRLSHAGEEELLGWDA